MHIYPLTILVHLCSNSGPTDVKTSVQYGVVFKVEQRLIDIDRKGQWVILFCSWWIIHGVSISIMMISNTSGCHCYMESYKCWASILWNIQLRIMQLFPQRKNMSRLAFNPRMPHIWLYQNNRLYSLRRWHPWVIRHYCFSKWQQIIIMKNHIVDNGIPLTYIVHTKIMCWFCLSQKIG